MYTRYRVKMMMKTDLHLSLALIYLLECVCAAAGPGEGRCLKLGVSQASRFDITVWFGSRSHLL